MAPWIILVFSLCGLLQGQETQPPTVQECCQDGRDAAHRGQDCSILTALSHSHTCRIVQEQCCTAALAERLCNSGVELARRQGACDVSASSESHISKMCCDCCLLGLSSGPGLKCNLQGLLVGTQCAQTAAACCSQNTKAEVPTLNSKDSSCSQLHTDDGSCGCRDGFQLQSDGVTCEDINECLTGSPNCMSGQTCINTEGSFRCQRQTGCGTGYELKDNNSCEDLDECALGTHNCGPQFTCTNTAGSFRCRPKEKCSVGLIQDAAGTCIDINECVANDSPCPSGHTCVNMVGSYVCRRNIVTCGRGYHLTEEGTRCEDIDECRTGNACVGHGCTNLVGTYRCECRHGYTFNTISRLCEDINECREHYVERLCAHKCENTEGSYQCSCTTGFKLSQDGKSCEDINECEQNPCNQECANVYGSYQCYCRRGYQLSDIDGITCDDIDECALLAGGHVCSYSCMNSPGSFSCTCPPTGYILGPSGRMCQDIDECASASHTCSVSESCFNVQGGFRCLSFQCPQHFRQVSQGRCERVTCEFARDPASCRSLPLRISFYNISFPTDTPVPADIFRMGPANSIQGDEMLFNVTSGDEEGFFVVQRQIHGGVITLRRVLSEPRDFLLTVEMRLIRYGTAHLYMAKIAVFVTHEQPMRTSRKLPHLKSSL
ncbi:fibulin-1-like isoform X2 [Solea senegalensis]|uniref:Fibulin-1 n=1 Tax=Solea senegalensis TaxID=28829 RepID=A0AAV6QWF0_SOLSE|nr:fibulin-1-like isoform X2 [Solea senegalensis]KAG7496648.1 fibulin-1-like isoform X2 [Solea senegalensis]